LPGERQQARRQPEAAAILIGEAGGDQGQQQPARTGAGQRGGFGHFGQRHAGRPRRQDRQNVEAFLQRANEIARSFGHAVSPGKTKIHVRGHVDVARETCHCIA